MSAHFMIHQVDSLIFHDQGWLYSHEFAAGYQKEQLWRRTILGRGVKGFPVASVREKKKYSRGFLSEGLFVVDNIYNGDKRLASPV